jgi:type II secretory pathway pseudopilin PulG
MKSSEKGSSGAKKRKANALETESDGNGSEGARKPAKSAKKFAEDSPERKCSMLESVFRILIKDKLLPKETQTLCERDSSVRDMVRASRTAVKIKGSRAHDLVLDFERAFLEEDTHTLNVERLFRDYNATYRDKSKHREKKRGNEMEGREGEKEKEKRRLAPEDRDAIKEERRWKKEQKRKAKHYKMLPALSNAAVLSELVLLVCDVLEKNVCVTWTSGSGTAVALDEPNDHGAHVKALRRSEANENPDSFEVSSLAPTIARMFQKVRQTTYDSLEDWKAKEEEKQQQERRKEEKERKTVETKNSEFKEIEQERSKRASHKKSSRDSEKMQPSSEKAPKKPNVEEKEEEEDETKDEVPSSSSSKPPSKRKPVKKGPMFLVRIKTPKGNSSQPLVLKLGETREKVPLLLTDKNVCYAVEIETDPETNRKFFRWHYAVELEKITKKQQKQQQQQQQQNTEKQQQQQQKATKSLPLKGSTSVYLIKPTLAKTLGLAYAVPYQSPTGEGSSSPGSKRKTSGGSGVDKSKMEAAISAKREVLFAYQMYGDEVSLSDPSVRKVINRRGTCEIPRYPEEALPISYKKKNGFSTTKSLVKAEYLTSLVENSASVLMNDEDRSEIFANFTSTSSTSPKQKETKNGNSDDRIEDSDVDEDDNVADEEDGGSKRKKEERGKSKTKKDDEEGTSISDEELRELNKALCSGSWESSDEEVPKVLKDACIPLKQLYNSNSRDDAAKGKDGRTNNKSK